tara:strand:- start:44388 stop:44678 length:291 start_codon:yes stop_codon:yes gene_type:complete
LPEIEITELAEVLELLQIIAEVPEAAAHMAPRLPQEAVEATIEAVLLPEVIHRAVEVTTVFPVDQVLEGTEAVVLQEAADLAAAIEVQEAALEAQG